MTPSAGPTAALAEAALVRFAPGVWVSATPMRIVGMHLTATMAVTRMADGRLCVFSPVPLTAARRAAVERLGTVAHLYAPNTFHHAFIGAWAEAFPQARVHGPRALANKRPGLKIDRFHDEGPSPELRETFDEIHIEGFRLEESVLVHRSSKTLLVADLVHNIGRPHGWWTRLYSRAMGFYDRVALSRVIRWTAFADPAAARASLDQLCRCDFERMVVGHGAPLDRGAKRAIEQAYAWLGARRTPRLGGIVGAPRRGRCG